MTLAAVILAAGASERLGTCKATVRIGARSALEHLLTQLSLALPETTPLVISGAHDEELRAHCAGRGCRVVFNSAWQDGRPSSVASAVAAAPDADLLILPVDCPLVRAHVLRALVEAWDRAQRPARGWLAPSIATADRRRYGHPVLLGQALARQAGADARPLRALREEADPLFTVEVDDPAILDNLDTPAALTELRARHERASQRR